MRVAHAIAKVGSYSLPSQCALLCIALLGMLLKLGVVAGWLYVASLLAGVVTFAAGLVASIALRNARWLSLSAAAAFVGFFSLILGITVGGSAGV
jgi:membrane glycosyltransferase